MPFFSYTALGQKNAYLKGRLEARHQKSAIALLERQGLMIINIKREEKAGLDWWQRFNRSASAQDKIFFTRNIHTMLEAGVSMDQAIKTTAEQVTNRNFRTALDDIYGQLQQGRALHRALQQHPQYFSPFYVSLVNIGESSGKLDEVLSHLLEQQERDVALRTKAKSAMIYPSIIVLALVGMVTLMMVFVIPKVAGILTSYDVTLPLATRVLIWLSNLFIHQGWLVAIVVILGVIGFRRWVRTERGRWHWDKFVLKLPRISTIVAEFNLALFTRSLSALLQSGIQLDQALALAAKVCSQSPYRQSAAAGIPFIQKGVPLAEVLKGHPGLYPPLTIRLIEVGQKTGKLDQMLRRLAVYYEQSVATSLTNLSSVIEPLLLLLIGATVGFVAIAVLTPIWKFSATV